jgi:hypothetical protein
VLSTSISVTGSSPPATHKRSSRTSSREITFRNVDHIHESSANQIGRSNYGGRVSVSPQSVIIVTNAGQVEGVFTSFRALSQSNGVSHINIEGVYETYTETELKDIFAMGKHFQYFGMKCKIMVMPVNQ